MKAIIPAWKANSISHNWFNEFDQIFESLFDQSYVGNRGLACDIEESEKFILFSFDLPGLREEDIKIELKDSILSISGERKNEFAEEKSRRFRGRHYGVFKQSFRIPKNIDQENIEADYTQGVLKVLLPKNAETSPQRVEVKSKKGGFLTDLIKR